MKLVIDQETSRDYLPEIKMVYAFLSHGEDGEGLIAANHPRYGYPIPLVCADETRMELLKPLAKQIASESGRKVKLVKFSVRTELETYDYAH